MMFKHMNLHKLHGRAYMDEEMGWFGYSSRPDMRQDAWALRDRGNYHHLGGVLRCPK